jgi:Icc-related predicted phosphoesterase
MKILCLSDEECPALWDYYTPGKLKAYDLIFSCGDLKASYLSFIVTMARAPVLYVHGNHDTGYSRKPPEGCDCIEDQLIVYNGLRILGLGGCRRYRPGDHQYTDKEMRKRIRKLRFKLWWHKGVDIVIAHAAPYGVGDDSDVAHRGFEAFVDLIEKYQPKYFLHGHIHMNYGQDIQRVKQLGATQVINVYERYELDIDPNTLHQS